MTPHRPSGVNWFCALAILGALWDLVTGQLFYSAPPMETRDWIAGHQTESLIQLGLIYFYATVALFTCYFMLSAKDWARWTYVGISTVRFGVAFALLALDDAKQNYAFFCFRAGMLPGLLMFLLALGVLFTRDARDYFHGGGRPWWKIEEADEARERRKAARKAGRK